MKTSSAIVSALLVLFLYACTPDEPVTLPIVITDSVYQYMPSEAIIFCSLTNNGHSPISATGVVVDIHPGASMSSDNTFESGETDLGPFVRIMNGLTPKATYYVRAYATNNLGTSYGKELSFVAMPDVASRIVTSDYPSHSFNTAKVSMYIAQMGTAKVIESGLVYSKKDNPTVEEGKIVNDTGFGAFTAELSGLTANTKYYARGYAVTRSGADYGNTVSFTTSAYVLPTVLTFDPAAVTVTSCQVKINVSSIGTLPVTERGVVYGKMNTPTVTTDTKVANGSGLGMVIVNVTGLQDNTIYHARSYATSDAGTSYGKEIIFQTYTAALPTLYQGEYRDLSGPVAYRLSGNREIIVENKAAYLYGATNSIITVSGGYEVLAQRIGWSPVVWYIRLAADNNALSIGSADASTRTVYKVVARMLQEVYYGSGSAGIFWKDYLTWKEKNDQGVELSFTYTETNRTDWSVFLTRSDGALYRIDVNTKSIYRAASFGSPYSLLYTITQMH